MRPDVVDGKPDVVDGKKVKRCGYVIRGVRPSR